MNVILIEVRPIYPRQVVCQDELLLFSKTLRELFGSEVYMYMLEKFMGDNFNFVYRFEVFTKEIEWSQKVSLAVTAMHEVADRISVLARMYQP